LLLRPGPHFNDLLLGALGRAQRRYGMTIHYCTVLSNHYHLLVCRIHGCKNKVWARLYQAIVVSNEEKAQIAVGGGQPAEAPATMPADSACHRQCSW